MAEITNRKKHNNLVFALHPYQITMAGLADNSVLSALIIDNDDNAINANAPLYAPKNNNSFSFNTKTLLANANIFKNNALPVETNGTIFLVTGLVKSFRLKAGKTISEAKNYYFGKAPARIFEVFDQTFFENFNKLGNPFLSFSPVRKRIKTRSVEYLYYLNNLIVPAQTIKLIAKIKLYDNTTQTITIATITDCLANAVIGCNVSLTKIIAKFANVDISNVKSYEIWLKSETDTVLTEVRSYIIDNSFAEDTHTILFRNQYSVFETFHFDGQFTEMAEYNFASFENENNLVIDYETTAQTKLTFRASNLEINWVRHISEAVQNSNEVYWLHPDGRKIRLTKQTKSIQIVDPQTVVERIELDFKIA